MSSQFVRQLSTGSGTRGRSSLGSKSGSGVEFKKSDSLIQPLKNEQGEDVRMPREVKIVLSMAMIANMAYWQLAPFYPKFLEERNIDEWYLGFVMSAFAASFIVGALFTGEVLLHRIYRLNGCFTGALLVVVNLVGLGALDYLGADQRQTIIALSFIFQIIGGLGAGINSTATMAVLSGYKEQKEIYIGYFEVTCGLGAFIGPLVGSMFYFLGGYKAPFFCVGFFYLTMVIVFSSTSRRKPENTDVDNDLKAPLEPGIQSSYVSNTDSVDLDDERPTGKEKLRDLELCEILSMARSGLGLVVQFMCYFIFSYNIPILNSHMLKDEGYEPIFVGFLMTYTAFCYACGLPLEQLMTSKVTKRGCIFIGLCMQSAGVVISGQSSVLHYGNAGIFAIVGLTIFGFGTTFVTIPAMPEILDSIEERKSNFNELSLQNRVAGYFIVCQGLGESAGPLVSSLLKQELGFRNTQYALGVFVACFLVIYISACGVHGFFSLNKKV